MNEEYSVWRSGGQTGTVRAGSAYQAAVQFLHERDIHARPIFMGGTAMGSNCAHYTAVQGDEIKVWKK